MDVGEGGGERARRRAESIEASGAARFSMKTKALDGCGNSTGKQ